MQDAVDIHDLDELGRAELVEQRGDVEVGPASASLAPGVQRTGPYYALQPQLLALERSGRLAFLPRPFQSASRPAQRDQACGEFRVGGGPHPRHGERGGPPPLAPGQQQPWPAGPGGMALAQRGEFGAVRGRLRPQFRRAEAEPVLLDDLKPAAARREQGARIGGGLGPQRGAEPAAGPGHRRTPASAPGRRGEMTVGVGAAAEFGRHPPGQQVGLYHLAGAERFQPGRGPVRLAEHGRRTPSGGVARLREHQRRLRFPPGALLGPEQPVGPLRPVQGRLRLPGGQRAVGRHQQQTCPLRDPATDRLELLHRRVRLGQRVTGQPGREQDGAPVRAQRRQGHAQRANPVGRLIEEGKRGREVSRSEGHFRAVLHNVGRLEHLVGFREPGARKPRNRHQRGLGSPVTRKQGRGRYARGPPTAGPPRGPAR